MHILLCTTWRQQCGIATYSQQLATVLVAQGVRVTVATLYENEVGLLPGPAESIIPYRQAWHRRGADHSDLVRLAKQLQPDVIHIQHEYGLWQLTTAFTTVAAELAKVAPTVTTLHTLQPSGGYARTGLYRELRDRTHCLIAHTEIGAASLEAVPGCGVVHCIPHGTPEPLVGDRQQALSHWQIPELLRGDDQLWLLALGFLSPGKNIEATVRAYAEALCQEPQLQLNMLLCGAVSGAAEEFAAQRLPWVIDETGLGDRIVYRPGYVKDEDLGALFSLASFGVLNAASNWYSASGQAHLYAAQGLPLAVANKPIYADAIKAGAIPFEVDALRPGAPTVEMVNAVLALARSERLRRRVASNMRAFAKATAWPRLVETKYLPLYKWLIGKTPQGAQG